MKASALCLVVLVLLGPAAPAQEPPALTEDQTLARCLAELKIAAVRLDHYSFTKRVTFENHGKNGKVTHHEEREFAFVPRPDGRFDVRLLTVNGAPPSEKQLKEHEKEMNKEFSKSDEQLAQEKKKAEEEDTSLSQDFLEYFDFKLAGREDWNGKPTFRIEFAPKPEIADLKGKNRKILRKMGGHAWVSQSGFRLLGSEMHNLESIKIWGGMSGVDHLVTRIEYVGDTSGPYLPKLESVEWEVRVGFSRLGPFYRKEEYSNFHSVEAK